MDSTWVDLPIGDKIAAHKHPLNLAPNEVLQLQDVNTTRAPGSFVLRKVSENLSPSSMPNGVVLRVGQQIRPDGVKTLASVVRVPTAQKRLFVVNPENGSWITAFGNLGERNLGDGDADMAISPDAIRACGEEGLSAVVKLGTLPYIEGGVEVMPRQFNRTRGRQALPWVGIGYVAWDGEVKTLDGYIELNPIERRDSSFDTWFGSNTRIKYFLSVTYEGGQESPLWDANHGAISTDSNNRSYYLVTIRINNILNIPFAAKRINVYRAAWENNASAGQLKSSAVLVHSVSIYRETEEDQTTRGIWQYLDSSSPIAVTNQFSDLNEASVIGGTYFDRQQLSHEVDVLSPYRRHHRLFSDRLFAWGVVSDDGKIYGNRLYYSHVNGLGISCYDIIPPANYVEFPFNIVGLVSSRSHRIVIGDSKYAIGYFGGGAIQNWRIYESETEMGCMAPESVADTPFGAAYVGYDGIYVLNGLESHGPIGRGVIYPTQDTYDWASAKAEFSQDDQEYIVFVHTITERNPLVIAVNLQTGAIRRLAGIKGRVVAVGKDSLGKVLYATNEGVFKLEAGYGSGIDADSPKPVIETGIHRFLGSGKFQKIRNIAIQGKWGPGSLKVTITGHNNVVFEKTLQTQGDNLIDFGVNGLNAPTFGHKVKLEYVPKLDPHISTFQIDKVLLDVQASERTVK